MSNKKSIFSWCLYDWANSAFSTIMLTFVFSVFFADHIVGQDSSIGMQGSALWGYTISASAFIVAILSPFFGSFADHYGRLKRFVFVCLLLCSLATAACFIGVPNASAATIWTVCVFIIIANVTLELSLVFYNAMLPSVAPKDSIGRVSGWGWALGYVGGLLSLICILVLFIGLGKGFAPLLELPTENAFHVRVSVLFVVVWMLIFSLPLFLWVKEDSRGNKTVRRAWSAGLKDLKLLVTQFRQHTNFIRFLIGSAIYRDGLGTLFAIGGVFAASVYGMAFSELIIFGIILNISAGFGALVFSFLDDRLGSKKTIILALLGLIVFGFGVLLAQDKMMFMILTSLLGIFIGPAQAAGRTMVARIVDEKDVTQAYGLYAMCGKSIAFTGPLLYGIAITYTGSQQAGLSVILVLWIIGLLLICSVKEPRGKIT